MASPTPPPPEQPETFTSTPEKPSEPPTPEEPSSSSAEATVPTAVAPTNGDWQAIFSPQHNTYYFYNTITAQTTWENPLLPQPQPQSQPEAAASSSSSYDAALAAGIDPSLAYLDPALSAPAGSSSAAYTATAKFNARTGRFTANDARDPTHMSEYERAKRMSEFYFDVGAWESQRDQQQQEEEAEGKKRKRPSKKDLDRFKEQKRLKKIAKTAWLRT
ncbi:hypothetical protein ARMSODRAFT_1023098 [Armillaria solidipes]|uniref:WW domain-containing protein n=1 Tax=Armillaria solidipes TaxID=1076256 RepID=A0A2H3B496_9AGAR|nr:hypothetical protein ARMSODRAFT_1023098 [Armillaria solidipes]